MRGAIVVYCYRQLSIVYLYRGTILASGIIESVFINTQFQERVTLGDITSFSSNQKLF